MQQPVLNQTKYELLDIDIDGYLSLINDNGQTREDLQIPDNELGQEITDAFVNSDEDIILTILSWGDEETIMSFQKK